MRIRVRHLLLLAVLATVLLLPGSAGAASFNIASETYYTLDVAAGRITTRMEAEVGSANAAELKSVVLVAMPGATNIAVTTEAGAALQFKATPANLAGGVPTLLNVTLEKPLKGALRANLVLTYDIPAQDNEVLHIEKGAIEGRFASQGPGSFVYVDVPITSDKYFEPGCLLAASQPGAVKDAARERWICGDAALITLNTNDKEVLSKCAQGDDRCRQQAETYFNAYAQTITDASLIGLLEGTIDLQRGPVMLTLKYFRRDQAWADKQFAVAKQALPMLEATYGWGYQFDRILMRQSHAIEQVGAAGLAFSDEGQVFMAKQGDIDEEVTVHELAHLWSGYQLETSWLWEGLAEYGLRRNAGTLGIKPRDWRWTTFGFKDPLATWWGGSKVTEPYYWYGKAGTFWFEYEKAIGGPAAMTAVLAQMDDYQQRWPLDGRWFMDRGEEVSGKNLDALFLEWVWVPDVAKSFLGERRAAHDQVAALTARAATYGFAGVPKDIRANLDAWTFGAIAGQVTQGNRVLDAYSAAQAAAVEAGLPPNDGGVAAAWPTQTLAGISGVIDNQRQAIKSIVEGRKAIAGRPAEDGSWKKIADAEAKYATGDFEGAQHAATGASTFVQNYAAAGKMIQVAKEKQASFKPSFFTRIGMYWADPSGDLAKAEAAYLADDPATALKLASKAYDGWKDAQQRGIARLAILMGLMCALTVGTWWLMKKLDPSGKGGSTARMGHYIEKSETTSRWKDWENTR